jgi:mannose-6-phosphate isomerase-like protein (cupin superfamily)
LKNYIKNCNRSSNRDCGPEPFVTNIADAVRRNKNFRTAIWTGCRLQSTLMCISVGDDIGLECHPDTDQFLRIECGKGMVCMGPCEDDLNFRCSVCEGSAVFVPAGTWHNIICTGNCPLKLYSIYAPPHHPRGTVQCTKEDAEMKK